jgi:leucyl aminopeptidase
MIKIQVTDKGILDQNVDCFAFLMQEGAAIPADLKAFEQLVGVPIGQYLLKHEFTGKLLETFALPVLLKNNMHHVIMVGLGKPGKDKKISMENYRRAMAHLYKQVAAHKALSCAITVPSTQLFKSDVQDLGQQATIALQMAAYHFDEYITDKDRKAKIVNDITLCVSSKEKTALQRGVKDGDIIAQAVNKTRHWVNLPPVKLTPVDLADKAVAIAKKSGLKCTVFNEKQIIEKGMGGLAAVGAGSDQDSKLVILEYHTKKKNAPTIAFVGKGITFDSGGLSLKPAKSMETMKEDMSGAAAVITTMEALAQLKPNVNVIGVAPLAENLPSGKATKPGDIITFYNGKTAEVKNTDAEGRLILADALSYAVKQYKPDAIIDIATLTGACAYALGPFFTGLMSQDDELVDELEDAAKRTGDRVWRLPLDDDYKKAVQSDVADLCNIGNSKYMAGTITAAHFLKAFVGNTPWAHLDIAGTAFDVPDMPYFRTGATGAGVRLLIDVAMHW